MPALLPGRRRTLPIACRRQWPLPSETSCCRSSSGGRSSGAGRRRGGRGPPLGAPLAGSGPPGGVDPAPPVDERAEATREDVDPTVLASVDRATLERLVLLR